MYGRLLLRRLGGGGRSSRGRGMETAVMRDDEMNSMLDGRVGGCHKRIQGGVVIEELACINEALCGDGWGTGVGGGEIVFEICDSA